MSRKSKSHRPSIQAQMDACQNSIDYLIAQHEEMKAHLSASRRDTRSMAYFHILLCDEALRLAEMYEDHKTKGDVLDPKESLFLDVFRKRSMRKKNFT